MDEGEQTSINKLYNEEGNNESYRNQIHKNDSGGTKKCSKSSSFLFGEQFCGYGLPTHTNRKRHSVESFDEHKNTSNHCKKSKSSASPQSLDEGSTSTCSDEDKDLSYQTTPGYKPFSSQIPPTTCLNRDFSSASHYPHYPNSPFLKSVDSKRRPDFNHYPSQNHRISGESLKKDFFSSIKPSGIFPYILEDGEDRNDGLGSELLIGAYNNFVRKVVDETLDRTITFCEQPRNAISALERICSKAWPQLEAKRHRNRIRAYLKACRRNSKKNRGQINMKEPPMNALSAEARQMVATAMNLVRKDIEQLREDLKRDRSPSVFTAKNGTLPPNLRLPETASSYATYQTKLYTNPSNSSIHPPTRPSKLLDDHCNLSKSSSFQSLFPTLHPLSKSSAGINFQNTHAWLDPQYLSTLMRFLPSSAQFKTDLETSFRAVAASGALGAKLMDSNENLHNRLDRKSSEQFGSTLQSQPPPAAHFAVAKYSPTLNQATSMLLEVRPLSQ
ncbi:unnamed protein product, partial [Rodentolepis nana]|uniref:Ubinuclein middle domain-containing protein n=1 Tax=Rodentolepis nana TaxID=102285 RepID=A0A0R3U0W2_RODNA